MKNALRTFLALETLRLAAWLMVLTNSSSARDGYSNEVQMVSVLESNLLGFPYSWPVAMLVGRWDLGFWSDIATSKSVLLDHFTLWLVCTGLIAAIAAIFGRQRQRRS